MFQDLPWYCAFIWWCPSKEQLAQKMRVIQYNLHWEICTSVKNFVLSIHWISMVQYTHANIFIFIPLLCPTMELMKNVHHIKAVTTGCRSTFITRYSILASLGILWRLLDSIVQVVVLWLMGEGCGAKQRGEFQIFHTSRLCRNGMHLKCHYWRWLNVVWAVKVTTQPRSSPRQCQCLSTYLFDYHVQQTKAEQWTMLTILPASMSLELRAVEGKKIPKPTLEASFYYGRRADPGSGKGIES